MPKPNFVLNDFHKREIFKKICMRVGFPIRTKLDCKKVSELIEKEGLIGVSESTIYRLFLFNDSSNRPYLHTLNVLASFTGFIDWNDFEAQQNKIDSFLFGFGKFEDNGKIDSLISVCIRTNELKPLFTYSLQLNEINDSSLKGKFAEEIFKATLLNSDNELFFKNFYKLPVIREYYFELLADPTFSIPGYEIGIEYYLKDLKPEESLKDLQDYIFGNCLLFRHYYMTKKIDKAQKVGRLLFDELSLTDQQLSEIHIFPIARYLSCKLLYLDLNHRINEIAEFLAWLMLHLTKEIIKLPESDQRILFYCIGESFILNSYITLKEQNQFKELFAHLFELYPKQLFDKNLEKIVPYFNRNGSVYLLDNI